MKKIKIKTKIDRREREETLLAKTRVVTPAERWKKCCEINDRR